ncbi:proclotting enzyme-like isoform X3 [Tachypleus tridentatus]|uniref:proclotting enzyme-like isoform X3 n=1 Tax=Tachypleus tridentatus TaxID=6853 RepID=UPI003FD523F9
MTSRILKTEEQFQKARAIQTVRSQYTSSPCCGKKHSCRCGYHFCFLRSTRLVSADGVENLFFPMNQIMKTNVPSLKFPKESANVFWNVGNSYERTILSCSSKQSVVTRVASLWSAVQHLASLQPPNQKLQQRLRLNLHLLYCHLLYHPTAVYLRQGSFKSAQCGGALVTNKHVITASHCVVNNAGTDVLPAEDFSVRLGEHNLFSTNDSSDPIDFPIKSVKRHEDFELKTYKNDIAILTIDGTVTFTNRIQPICLPYNNLRLEDLAMRKPFVAGWGTTAFNGPSSPVLREVQVPVWEHESCQDAYKNDVNITNVYMCAGFAVGGKDACQGDSGGPLMLPHEKKFHLIGIVSFGKSCAQPGFPGVYTRVTEFLNWIAVNLV